MCTFKSQEKRRSCFKDVQAFLLVCFHSLKLPLLGNEKGTLDSVDKQPPPGTKKEDIIQSISNINLKQWAKTWSSVQSHHLPFPKHVQGDKTLKSNSFFENNFCDLKDKINGMRMFQTRFVHVIQELKKEFKSKWKRKNLSSCSLSQTKPLSPLPSPRILVMIQKKFISGNSSESTQLFSGIELWAQPNLVCHNSPSHIITFVYAVEEWESFYFSYQQEKVFIFVINDLQSNLTNGPLKFLIFHRPSLGIQADKRTLETVPYRPTDSEADTAHSEFA